MAGRRFARAFALLAACGAGTAAFSAEPNLRPLISRADLDYPAPVERSEDGLPIGNGRTGSLVWTSPSALKFQINRVDVQSVNRDTRSFFERNTDYMGGCGWVDVQLTAAGDDVFTSRDCPQHLSVYDGLATLKGRGVTARVLAWPARDVLAVEIDDQRARPEELIVDLRMLRQLSQHFGAELEKMTANHIVSVRTRNHLAASQLSIHGDRIVLTQDFREGDHHAKSAVAIALRGRPAKAIFANDTTVRLAAPAARGKATLLIASAASLNSNDDIAAAALAELDAADNRDFGALARETAEGWHAFWARGSVDLHSGDGTAEYVADQYHYFLYLMAATSRGKYPPKFNGMLWNTAGDLRTWGAQHWFANLSCYYEALFASNRLELLDPVFDMYSGMYDSLALAARQEWSSQGIYIPETVWFDGLARLPDDIAAEMSDLYLLRKPWDHRSTRFKEFSLTQMPHSSRWNWIGGGSWVDGRWLPSERGAGPYGPVSHILGTTAKIPYLFWRRYEYTLDEGWLRTRAYPMLKGAAEFYRHFPNLRKDEDGKYHLHHVNSNESVWGARDSDEDLSALNAILPAVIRASEILKVDESLRSSWRELLANLAPLPTSTDSDALKRADFTGPRVFLRGRQPAIQGGGGIPDGNSLPMWFFDLCNPDGPDADRWSVANATFDYAHRGGIGPDTRVGVLSKWAVAGATLGRADALRFLVPNQMKSLTAEREVAYRGGRPLANRLSLREGQQAMDAQRLGRSADALEIALLNSNPPAPAQDPLLRLFSAWPSEWDATFTLRARGGFVVTAAQHGGNTDYVELVSEAGAPCRLRNPWPDSEVVVKRDGHPAESLRGAILTFATHPGEHVRLEK
jgi:hypothetical protein